MPVQPKDASFAGYVLARQASLLRTAWLLTGDWHLAQDLVQAALVRSWRQWDRVDRSGRDAYVRQVMLNLQRSWWRRRWTSEVPTDELPDQAVAEPWASIELAHTVRTALQRLPPRQRAAVVLRYFDDLTEVETARLLSCSVGTVKSQTFKALRALQTDPRLSGLLLEELLP